MLVLRYYVDRRDAEIADALGCRQGTVRSLAARAFAALRAHPAAVDGGPAMTPTSKVTPTSSACCATTFDAQAAQPTGGPAWPGPRRAGVDRGSSAASLIAAVVVAGGRVVGTATARRRSGAHARDARPARAGRVH